MMHNLSGIAKDLAPAIANHLWQSTLFAVVAGLLTLTLRRNQASIRYSLWFAASAKFLVPFSLLTILGAHLAIPHTAGPQTTVYTVVVQASQPFTQPSAPAIAQSPLLALLPEALALLWLAGFVVVLARWVLRWRRIFAATRRASRISSGREVEALRHLELAAGIKDPIPFLLSQDSMEPGVFGVAHPVLLWPAGISTHLHDAHLKAILAHEVWHVRRRDNLAAALHMFVEAVFWFYPLVWWTGARLIDERERACDEAVLTIGNEPEIYAESILKACEFCVESPLSCVSGVTGSNLKKRIVRIMTQQLANKLTRAKKLMLATAGIAAITAPIAIGIVDSPIIRAQSLQRIKMPLPAVEVVTLRESPADEKERFLNIQEGRIVGTNWTVKAMIKLAYQLNDTQLSGGPAWIDSARYDVDIKSKDPSSGETVEPGHPLLLLQSFLADRFHLALSEQTRDLPVYALVVASGGPKLTEVPAQTLRSLYQAEGPSDANLKVKTLTVEGPAGDEPVIKVRTKDLDGKGGLMVNGPVSALADQLSGSLGRQVIDKTGLNGNYSMALHWTPGVDRFEAISTELHDKLGLDLEPGQGPVGVSVIDQIEQPSTN